MPPAAIIHLDMDAFYASVEQRDRPELRGMPVIVGGHPKRGVVLAASYEVRPLGVHSAMPMAIALRKAPQAIVVSPRMEAYEAASDQIFAILGSVTPLIEWIVASSAILPWPKRIRGKCPIRSIASTTETYTSISRTIPYTQGEVSLYPGLRIDTCEEEAKARLSIPAGAFAGRFFVSEWNAFIHFVARDVRLLWLEAN